MLNEISIIICEVLFAQSTQISNEVPWFTGVQLFTELPPEFVKQSVVKVQPAPEHPTSAQAAPPPLETFTDITQPLCVFVKV
jgi:hypothetical protein